MKCSRCGKELPQVRLVRKVSGAYRPFCEDCFVEKQSSTWGHDIQVALRPEPLPAPRSMLPTMEEQETRPGWWQD